MYKTVIASLALAAVLSAPATAKPLLNLNHKTYEVNGANTAEVTLLIEKGVGPLINGRRYWAETQWGTPWRVTWRQTRGGCAMTSVVVTANITIVMPKIVNTTVRAQLADSMEVLFEHEMGHAEIAWDTANKVEAALWNISGPCGSMNNRAHAIANTIVKEGSRMQSKYDDVTAHGAHQDELECKACDKIKAKQQ